MGAPNATLSPLEHAALSSSRIFRPLSLYFGNSDPTRYPTHVEMCTNGPSFPKHMPVLTAKTAPKALTTSTFSDRNDGIEKPLRMVLISGILLGSQQRTMSAH